MRHAVARSAVLAATVALAVACTGEAGVTIGPPASTGPSTGSSIADAAILALRLADVGERRGACLRSSC